MIDRVEIRAVTVAAQTTQANATTTDVSFDAGYVQRIGIVIPDGHAGVTGLALSQGGGAILIPASGNVWIISNDEKLEFDFRDYIGSGSWQAFAYNNDFANAHTFYLRFFVQEIGSGQQAPVGALGESVILAAAASVTSSPAQAASSQASSGALSAVRASSSTEGQASAGSPSEGPTLAATLPIAEGPTEQASPDVQQAESDLSAGEQQLSSAGDQVTTDTGAQSNPGEAS